MTQKKLHAGVLIVAALVLAPGAARADDINFNVPVRLSNLASSVTKGRIMCRLEGGMWKGLSGDRNMEAEVVARIGGSASTEFAVANGAYTGTVAVRVVVPGPPQAWVDAGRDIVLSSLPAYACYVQLATASSAWQPVPDIAVNDVGPSGGATLVRRGFMETPPSWALPAAGDPVFLTGPLQRPAGVR